MQQQIQIPTRENFLNDNDLIDYKEPLLFLPIDVEDLFFKEYKLKLSGILINGKKVIVYLSGIKIFFDILVNKNQNQNQNQIIEYLNIQKYEIIKKYPINEYNKEKKTFIRVYSDNLTDRKNLLTRINEETEYKTYSNDLTYYRRKIAREYQLKLTEWNILEKYSINSEKTIIDLSINDFKLLNQNEINNSIINNYLNKEKIMIMTWDIETYSSRPGELPTAKYDEDEVFMLCMTIHWKDETIPLQKICLTTQQSNFEDDWLLIVCQDQIELIKQFAECLNKLNPDFIFDFNGSQYDWPFIIGKAQKFGILKDMIEIIINKKEIENDKYYIKNNRIKMSKETIEKYYIKKNNIKVNAGDNQESCSLKIFGIIPIDVRIVYRKLYPNSEKSSLKYFLDLVNLESKLDLPIKDLFKYYSEAKYGITNIEQSRKNMFEIAKYCLIDAQRCQELMVKLEVLKIYQEVSSVAYVSLSDSYFYAGGMKVRNLIGAYANKMDILITMNRNDIICKVEILQNEIKQLENTIKQLDKKDQNLKQELDDKEKELSELIGKYPGAYVFPPDKGLEDQ